MPAMSAAYALLFGATFSSYYGHSLKAYVAALFTGLVVVNFFTSSTQTALTSIVAHGMLATKVKVPLEAFPISDVVAAAFDVDGPTLGRGDNVGTVGVARRDDAAAIRNEAVHHREQ